MKKNITLLIIVCFSFMLNGQNLKKIDTLKRNYLSQKNDTVKINLANRIGELYRYAKKDSALFYYQKALVLSKKIDNKNKEAISLFNIAYLQLREKQYGKSISNFDASKLIFEKQQNKLMVAKVFNYLGFCYTNLFSEDIAVEYLIKSLNIFNSLNDENGIFLNYSDLGTLFYNQKNYSFAKKYYTKALKTGVKLNDSLKITVSYLNLGNAVSDEGGFKKGLEYYKKSLAIAFALGDQNNIATNYNNMADSYKQLRNYEKSKSLFNKSLAIAKKTKNDELISIIYLNKSELAHIFKFNFQAIKFSKKSQYYAKKSKSVLVRLENFKILAETYESLGNIAKSHNYLKKYTSLKDSLNEINQQKTIKLFKALNQLEASTTKISNLSTENNKIKTKSKKEKNFIYGLIIALTIFAFLLILINEQYSKKQEAYNLLKYQNFKINNMHDEIEEQKDNLEKLNKAKDKLFSIIGHDLKNPINSIKGFSDLLLENSDIYPEEKKNKFLKIISNSTTKASELLDSLLMWANSQSNKMEFHPEKIELNELISNITSLLEAQAFSKNIKIKTYLKPNTFINVDKNMTKTIIRNLITNAIKFTKEDGLIEVSTKENKNGVEVEIKDNGVGMSKDDLKNLFSLTSKKTTKGTANEEGSGLGLLLVKDFVGKNNGDIMVESELNKGSVFRITFPKYVGKVTKIKDTILS